MGQTNPQVQKVLKALADKGCKPKHLTGGWRATCPVHDDTNPSLDVAVGVTQPVVLHCKAGCHRRDIIKALGLQWSDILRPREQGETHVPPPEKDVEGWVKALWNTPQPLDLLRHERGLTDEVIKAAGLGWRQDKVAPGEKAEKPGHFTIPIWQAHGQLRYLKEYYPMRSGGKKYMAPEHTKPALFGEETLLPLKDNDIVLVTEGEMDALFCRSLGYNAVSSTASGTWREPWSRMLSRFRVVAVGDRDETGEKYQRRVLKGIRDAGGTAEPLVWPSEVPEKTDPSSFILHLGYFEETFASLVNEAVAAQRNPFEKSRLSFEKILDPSVGEVDYVIDGLLPRGNLSIIAADWKTGKTILLYRLILDLLFGQAAFGSLDVDRAYKIGLFQMEMPSEEDLRRFRRLAIGMGHDPAEVLEMEKRGMLNDFSQPLVSLRDPQGRRYFHQTIFERELEVVFVDSLIAGFAPADMNDNAVVRDLIAQTFVPLTQRGITCASLHHYKKHQAGDSNSGSFIRRAKSAVLGAMQIGAAASRTYGLERLDPTPEEEKSSDFRVRLRSLGSWTPTDTDLTLGIKDEDGGTSVKCLTLSEELRSGGAKKRQALAIKLVKLLKEGGPMKRQDAWDSLQVFFKEKITETAFAKALAFAKEQRWVYVTQESDTKGRYSVLHLGANA
jgi:hypothetical protein